MSERPKNILIIKPSSLGDMVLALQALSDLRRSFPDIKIRWLVRPEFATLLQNEPHLTHREIPTNFRFSSIFSDTMAVRYTCPPGLSYVEKFRNDFRAHNGGR